jgi:hypothetical protein
MEAGSRPPLNGFRSRGAGCINTPMRLETIPQGLKPAIYAGFTARRNSLLKNSEVVTEAPKGFPQGLKAAFILQRLWHDQGRALTLRAFPGAFSASYKAVPFQNGIYATGPRSYRHIEARDAGSQFFTALPGFDGRERPQSLPRLPPMQRA